MNLMRKEEIFRQIYYQLLLMLYQWNMRLPRTTYVSGSEFRQCTVSADCADVQHHTCRWLYNGCRFGQCMCNPVHYKLDRHAQCVKIVLGGDSCSFSLECLDSMRCSYGRCQCISGKLTSDRYNCVPSDMRLLGQSCSAHGDGSCYQKSAYGYTTNDVFCSAVSGLCSCADGYKHDGAICRRWTISEQGCKKSHHCEGGALCIDSRCICPTGYGIKPGRKAKCIKNGAKWNLDVGDICDEVNETRYCRSDLVCHLCPAESPSRCVKFRLTDDYPLTSGVSTTYRLNYDVLSIYILSSIILFIKQFAHR